MDHDAVEVNAAASGTLIDKHEGEFDKNCSGVSSSAKANYVVIQHADGSRAIYFHMKSGRITNKAIGQNITAGEVIGIVGSSGYSSGPHLHYEVWSGSTVSTLGDHFSGNCNAKNTQSWWANQKTYKEPGLIQASVHTTDVTIPACPMTEIPNQIQTFTLPFQGPGLPAGFAKFYIFLKNETNGKVVEMSILNPDKTIFTSWTRTSNNDSKFSFWGYSKKLTTVPGQYTFTATYNGNTCSQTFEVRVPSANSNLGKYLPKVVIYPNPFNLSATITVPSENEVVNYTILNSIGLKVKSGTFSSGKTDEIYREELQSGLYLLLLDIKKVPIGSAQLIIVD